jgi:hypothetical protein
MSPRTTDRLRLRFSLAVIGAYLTLACIMNVAPSVGVQHWWEERGPVVPHDSFPLDCRECHVEGSWHEIREDFTFDHLARTGVALEGAHAQAECLRCHNDRGPVQVFSARGCAGCHEDRHEGRLGKTCESCHTEADWSVRETITKHARTRFPLVGAHAAAACWRCHPAAQVDIFDRASPECITCHADDLARAQVPDHVGQGWVDDCQECHIPTEWSGAGFTHSQFPLTGAHRTAACEACHIGQQFSGLPSHCAGCHLAEFQATTDPPHVAFGFPQECDQCHSTSAWIPATFDHAGIVSACVTCHLEDYQGADDPDHEGLGFSLDCQNCHGTKTWQGAMFDHAGIVDGCVTCHLEEYQNTTDPDHENAGFPQNCEICHGTNTWFGATFDHDFPIDSGRHSHLDCADCHLRPNSFDTFSCTHCHEHNEKESGKEHSRVPGYTWNSAACYSCHPDGDD